MAGAAHHGAIIYSNNLKNLSSKAKTKLLILTSVSDLITVLSKISKPLSYKNKKGFPFVDK